MSHSQSQYPTAGPSLLASRALPSTRASAPASRRTSGKLSAYDALSAPQFDDFIDDVTAKIRASLSHQRRPVRHKPVTKPRSSLPLNGISDLTRDIFGQDESVDADPTDSRIEPEKVDELESSRIQQNGFEDDTFASVYPRLPELDSIPPPSQIRRRSRPPAQEQLLDIAVDSLDESEAEDDDEDSLPQISEPAAVEADDVIEIGSSDDGEHDEASVQRPGDVARPEYSDEDQDGSPEDSYEDEDVDQLQSSPRLPAPARVASPAWDSGEDEQDESAAAPNGWKREIDEDSSDDPEGFDVSQPLEQASPDVEQISDEDEPWGGIADQMDVDELEQSTVAQPAPSASAGPFAGLEALAASAYALSQQPDPAPPSPSSSSGSSLEYIENPFASIPPVQEASPTAPLIQAVSLPTPAAPLSAPAGFDDYDDDAAMQAPPVEAAQPVEAPVEANVSAHEATEPSAQPAEAAPTSTHDQPEPSASRTRVNPTMVDLMRRAFDREAEAALFGPDDVEEKKEVIELDDDDDEMMQYLQDDRTAAEKAEDDAARDEERYFDDEEVSAPAAQPTDVDFDPAEADALIDAAIAEGQAIEAAQAPVPTHPWASLLRGETDWTATGNRAQAADLFDYDESRSVSAAPPSGARTLEQTVGVDEKVGAEEEMDVGETPVAAQTSMDVDDDEEDDELRVTLMSRAGTTDTHNEPDILEPNSDPVESGDHTPVVELDDDEGVDTELIITKSSPSLSLPSKAQLGSNVLDAGEWDPSQPIVFGGESLEAAMREAAHDPARRPRLSETLERLGYDPNEMLDEEDDLPTPPTFSVTAASPHQRKRSPSEADSSHKRHVHEPEADDDLLAEPSRNGFAGSASSSPQLSYSSSMDPDSPKLGAEDDDLVVTRVDEAEAAEPSTRVTLDPSPEPTTRLLAVEVEIDDGSDSDPNEASMDPVGDVPLPLSASDGQNETPVDTGLGAPPSPIGSIASAASAEISEMLLPPKREPSPINTVGDARRASLWLQQLPPPDELAPPIEVPLRSGSRTPGSARFVVQPPTDAIEDAAQLDLDAPAQVPEPDFSYTAPEPDFSYTAPEPELDAEPDYVAPELDFGPDSPPAEAAPEADGGLTVIDDDTEKSQHIAANPSSPLSPVPDDSEPVEDQPVAHEPAEEEPEAEAAAGGDASMASTALEAIDEENETHPAKPASSRKSGLTAEQLLDSPATRLRPRPQQPSSSMRSTSGGSQKRKRSGSPAVGDDQPVEPATPLVPSSSRRRGSSSRHMEVPSNAQASSSSSPGDRPRKRQRSSNSAAQLVPDAATPAVSGPRVHSHGRAVGPRSSSATMVTRSQCTFHKLLIPYKNAAPYLFLAPGCSYVDNLDEMRDSKVKDLGEATELELGQAVQLSPDDDSSGLPPAVLHALIRVVGPTLFEEGSCELLGRSDQPADEVPSSPERRVEEPFSPALVHGVKRKRDDDDIDISGTLIAPDTEPTAGDVPTPTNEADEEQPPRKRSGWFGKLFGR